MFECDSSAPPTIGPGLDSDEEDNNGIARLAEMFECGSSVDNDPVDSDFAEIESLYLGAVGDEVRANCGGSYHNAKITGIFLEHEGTRTVYEVMFDGTSIKKLVRPEGMIIFESNSAPRTRLAWPGPTNSVAVQTDQSVEPCIGVPDTM